MHEFLRTKLDEQWNMQYDRLVEFKRYNGHCIVRFRYGEDTYLGRWIRDAQRKHHTKNHMWPSDRRELVDEFGFFGMCSITKGICSMKSWLSQQSMVILSDQPITRKTNATRLSCGLGLYAANKTRPKQNAIRSKWIIGQTQVRLECGASPMASAE